METLTKLKHLLGSSLKNDKNLFEDFISKFDRFDMLTKPQEELVEKKWKLYSRLGRVRGEGTPSPEEQEDNGPYTQRGLKKQLELLGVDTFDEAVRAVAKMGPEGSPERVAWLEMADKVAKDSNA